MSKEAQNLSKHRFGIEFIIKEVRGLTRGKASVKEYSSAKAVKSCFELGTRYYLGLCDEPRVLFMGFDRPRYLRL